MRKGFKEKAVSEFIDVARKLVSEGAKESALRHNISAHLPRMFPDLPWWVKEHATCAEQNAVFHKLGQTSNGFVDTLVGATAIEYEKDISNPTVFATGYGQVEDYCADLLNKNVSQDLIIGVLSDTVRWKAYRVSDVKPLEEVAGAKVFGREHLTLEEIDECDLSTSSSSGAKLLGRFLTKNLGRRGARRLSAYTLSSDLGLNSAFSKPNLSAISSLVDTAFSSNHEYAELIEKLWKDFVSYLGGESAVGGFDRSTYADELYILTIAKLICANIMSSKALLSDNSELVSILDGTFFQNLGLSNLVEYDYFGWLNTTPHVNDLVPTARAIQDDLCAYDFSSSFAEDLFGELMAQLSRNSQRLLLGQEWTPSWLAQELVSNTIAKIPVGQDLRLVDMCCGSGAMVVEAVKQSKQRLLSSGATPGSPEALLKLSESITGFDVDPLAVILAKIGWVLSAREWLDPSIATSIPVYHADSLFAATPLTKLVDESGSSHHEMRLDDKRVLLPAFLISPSYRALFDLLLDRGYAMAMSSAQSKESELTDVLLSELVENVTASSKCNFDHEEMVLLKDFMSDLLLTLEDLQRAGRNGIWAFILRNSYRPGLVAGKFNGLVSNPPWLALSKIASNPYTNTLKQKADSYAIKPPGPAHLHVEMATIFLLHAVEKYLVAGAAIGCVLPESIMSAHHHAPFRLASYSSASHPVKLRVDELWCVEKGTFKNEAVVLFGTKDQPNTKDIPGYCVSKETKTGVTFKRIVKGNRTAWSSNDSLGAKGTGFFKPAPFRQGADVMPRTLIFHSLIEASTTGSWNISKITASSSERYLKALAKEYKTFYLEVNGVSDKVVFDVLLSHHLTPFDIGDGAKGLLPIKRSASGSWQSVSLTELASMGQATVNAFRSVIEALGDKATTQSYFDRIETRMKKLSKQDWAEGWLVFMGAGGSNVCAAYAPASHFDRNKTVIDQTLYWVEVESEEEAIYFTGLLNSMAINECIREFQPRGQFGERHIHKLPLGVTPPFDSENQAHIDVVDKTRQLVVEWNEEKANNSVKTQDLLDSNKSVLHIRRRKIKELLVTMPSWPEFENACRAVYCIE